MAVNGDAAARARQASVEAAALAEMAAVLSAHDLADEPGTPTPPAGSTNSATPSSTLSRPPLAWSSSDSAATRISSPADSGASPVASSPGTVVAAQEQPVAELPLDATSAAAAQPRRRLRGKQAAPPGFYSPPSRSRSPRSRIEYLFGRDRFRLDYCRKRPARQAYRAAWAESAKAWAALTAEQQEGWIRIVRSADHDIAPPEAALRDSEVQRTGKAGAARSIAVLLTFNGSWLSHHDILTREWPRRNQNPDRLCDRLAEDSAFVELMDRFWADALAHLGGQHAPSATASLELSLQSETPRVHLHLFHEFPDSQPGQRPRMASSDLLSFDNRRPSFCRWATPGRGNNRASKCLREGHFYLQAKKLGHVLCRTNNPKWKSWVVDAKFVWTLYRHRKISDERAAMEFAGARDRAHANVQEIRKGRATEYGIEAQAQWSAGLSRWQPLPFKPPSPLERSFLEQFRWRYQQGDAWASTPASIAMPHVAEPLVEAEPPRRYRFLVYSGPSRMGKTERACHWFGREETLVLNTQGIAWPNMREFMSGAWRAVVFDEGNWKLPAQNRALFQSGPRPVMLGQSNCNEAAYQVVMTGVPQIICSTDFWEDCSDLTARAWIESNCFFFLFLLRCPNPYG
jgi:hypothetical protein